MSNKKIDTFQNDLETIDEDEIQRKELRRLLTTAKDEDRVSLIQRSISHLERVDLTSSPSKARMPSPMSSFNSSHFNKYPVESVVGGRSRPVSAQKRRVSIPVLGAIPENRTLHHTVSDNNIEIDLPFDEISGVVSSSYDHRYPPINLFKKPFINERRCWVPTGLFPQILIANFKNPWQIRKVEVRGVGIECVILNIIRGNELNQESSIVLQRLEDRLHVYDASQANGTSLKNNSPSAVANAINLTFTAVTPSVDIFLTVLDVKVRVLPYV